MEGKLQAEQHIPRKHPKEQSCLSSIGGLARLISQLPSPSIFQRICFSNHCSQQPLFLPLTSLWCSWKHPLSAGDLAAGICRHQASRGGDEQRNGEEGSRQKQLQPPAGQSRRPGSRPSLSSLLAAGPRGGWAAPATTN